MRFSIPKGIAVAAFLMLASVSTVAEADPAAQNARRIAVTEGLSLVVSQGWSSCDPAINTQIGAEAPSKMLEKLCTEPPPSDMTVKLVKSQPGGFSVLMVAASKTVKVKFPTVEDAGKNFEKARAAVCDQLKLKSVTAGNCDIAPMTVGGMPAWAGHVTLSTEKDLTQNMRLVAFAIDGSPVLFMFDRMVFGLAPDKFDDDPDVEAMIASIAAP